MLRGVREIPKNAQRGSFALYPRASRQYYFIYLEEERLLEQLPKALRRWKDKNEHFTSERLGAIGISNTQFSRIINIQQSYIIFCQGGGNQVEFKKLSELIKALLNGKAKRNALLLCQNSKFVLIEYQKQSRSSRYEIY